jgi:hypothetical protein
MAPLNGAPWSWLEVEARDIDPVDFREYDLAALVGEPAEVWGWRVAIHCAVLLDDACDGGLRACVRRERLWVGLGWLSGSLSQISLTSQM